MIVGGVDYSEELVGLPPAVVDGEGLGGLQGEAAARGHFGLDGVESWVLGLHVSSYNQLMIGIEGHNRCNSHLWLKAKQPARTA